MYKLVSPRELTEIITGLLLKPELLGELDSPEKHRMFMADLGRVVAEPRQPGGCKSWCGRI
ncbi:hypothetical protein ABUU53_24435 [Escherichia coli]|uniref:hypothetical protein n=1 Tax=Escherichia coli TaxID=562 RepID=UPI00335BA7A6